MKDKLFTIILVAVFIVLLVIINSIVGNQNIANLNGQNVSRNETQVANNEEENEMDIMNVTSKNFEQEVEKSGKKVLIDFYADWCGPCKMLSPIVAQVAKENENIKVVKVNIDEEAILAAKYGITSIPTLVVVENGETKNISVGLISKSQVEELVK